MIRILKKDLKFEKAKRKNYLRKKCEFHIFVTIFFKEIKPIYKSQLLDDKTPGDNCTVFSMALWFPAK
jgi:hypothetical protein